MAKKGIRAVRLCDIAKEAGVSRVTVSQVLHGSGGGTVRVGEETRKRVLKIAKKLNYKPNRLAQQLRGVNTRLIGVVVDTWNMPVMSARLSALEREATRRDYRLMIGQSRHNFARIQEYLDDFEGRRVEGIVCLCDFLKQDEEHIRSLVDVRSDVVFHGKQLVETIGSVRVDTADGIRQVVEHLVDRGRRRMTLMLWNPTDEKSERRRAAYCEAIEKHNLRLEDNLIWYGSGNNDFISQESLDKAIDLQVAERHSDALIADDDMWAVRLIQRLKSRRYRVPKDVSVVGYDNLDVATVIEPPLTTVDQNHEAYAKAVLDLLLADQHIADMPPEDRVVTIKPRLMVRKST